MIRPLILTVACLSAVRAWGQGQVHFSNWAGFDMNQPPGAVLAPVCLPEPGNPALIRKGNTPAGIPAGSQVYGGGWVAGSNYTAQLWAGSAGCPEGQLQPVATSRFRSGALAGTIEPLVPAPMVPGIPAGALATFQLRVWDNRSGSITTWAQVASDTAILRGKSLMFTVPFPLGGGLVLPPNLQGLESFNLHVGTTRVPPQIARQPQSETVDLGVSLALRVLAYGTDPLAYQWHQNGQQMPGATNWTLQLPEAQSASAGDYTVVVSNPFGIATSAVATVAVRAAPNIFAQPRDCTERTGGSATFTVAAAGLGLLTYQWQRDGTNLLDGGSVSGATTPTLRLANVQPTDAGRYSVWISNPYGTAVSMGARLSVLAGPASGYPPVLRLVRVGNLHLLSWTTPHVVLQEAHAPEGPWQDVNPPSASPFPLPSIEPSRFYRVRPE